MKKAELSLNIVIAAALAMIVLVILSVLIFNTGTSLWEGTECRALTENADCYFPAQLYGESCEAHGRDRGERWTRHRTASCPDPQEICCVVQ